jgi:hypothetical protein
VLLPVFGWVIGSLAQPAKITDIQALMNNSFFKRTENLFVLNIKNMQEVGD